MLSRNMVSLLFSLMNGVLCFLLIGERAVFFVFQVSLASLLLCNLFLGALRSGSSIFHPLPMSAVAVYWAMALSPVVGVSTGEYLALPPKQIDFEQWFFYTSLMYFFCICAFCFGSKLVENRVFNSIPRVWNKRRLFSFGFFLLVFSFAAQLYVYYSMGGIIGYLTRWTENSEDFSGLGKVFVISEAFPSVLAVISLVVLFKPNLKNKTFWIVFAFLVFFVIKLFFGGFRGSRSNTIWGVFWFAGVVHLYVKRLNLKYAIFGAVFIFSFMTAYSIYKSFGIDAFSGQYNVVDTGRFGDSSPIVVMGMNDFSRVGVHSYILHEYFNGQPYKLKMGQTYLSPYVGLIPGANDFFNWHSKNSAGAELFYGNNVIVGESKFHNSRIYGLFGEGLLNFGPLFSIFAFFIAGFSIAFLNGKVCSYSLSDPRVFLIPFYSNACFIFLLNDFDNIMFFWIKNGLVLILLVYFSSSVKNYFGK